MQLAAAQRGVQVRVAITIPSASMPDTDLFTLMNASSNIQAHQVNMTQLVGAGIIHTKFFIADDTAFYVGSANLGAWPYTHAHTYTFGHAYSTPDALLIALQTGAR